MPSPNPEQYEIPFQEYDPNSEKGPTTDPKEIIDPVSGKKITVKEDEDLPGERGKDPSGWV